MLSLEEAIEHCYKKARELPANECECANEHFQLAAWLEELKARRAGEYITQGDIIRRMNNEQIARLLQMEAIMMFYRNNIADVRMTKELVKQLRIEYNIAAANSPFRFIKFRRGVTP